jgi:diacylglycerol kinase (ATP)
LTTFHGSENVGLVKQRFLAIVNPVAGSGRSGKLAGPALTRLRQKGLHIDVIASTAPGHAADLAREAWQQGYRQFIAVGGDGTAHEIVNGVLAESTTESGTKQLRASIGFLPLGTGNSFLRDFGPSGAELAFDALLQGRKRAVDVLRLTHTKGETYSLNLISMGFTADVGAFTNRYLKPFGPIGYLLGVFVRILQLRGKIFPLRCDEDKNWDARPCLFLTFNNSKYTGGNMLIAPHADPHDGLIEYVHWGPLGRLATIRMLPTLYDGSHIKHPLASRRAVRHVQFNFPGAADVIIDGEVATLDCRYLDILPGAVDIFV